MLSLNFLNGDHTTSRGVSKFILYMNIMYKEHNIKTIIPANYNALIYEIISAIRYKVQHNL